MGRCRSVVPAGQPSRAFLAGSPARTLVAMRLQRGMSVGGVEPERARDLARACHRGWKATGDVAGRLNLPADDAERMLHQLADAGFLERRDSSWPDETDEWNTTVPGGALTMASFLNPDPPPGFG